MFEDFLLIGCREILFGHNFTKLLVVPLREYEIVFIHFFIDLCLFSISGSEDLLNFHEVLNFFIVSFFFYGLFLLLTPVRNLVLHLLFEVFGLLIDLVEFHDSQGYRLKPWIRDILGLETGSEEVVDCEDASALFLVG